MKLTQEAFPAMPLPLSCAACFVPYSLAVLNDACATQRDTFPRGILSQHRWGHHEAGRWVDAVLPGRLALALTHCPSCTNAVVATSGCVRCGGRGVVAPGWGLPASKAPSSPAADVPPEPAKALASELAPGFRVGDPGAMLHGVWCGSCHGPLFLENVSPGERATYWCRECASQVRAEDSSPRVTDADPRFAAAALLTLKHLAAEKKPWRVGAPGVSVEGDFLVWREGRGAREADVTFCAATSDQARLAVDALNALEARATAAETVRDEALRALKRAEGDLRNARALTTESFTVPKSVEGAAQAPLLEGKWSISMPSGGVSDEELARAYTRGLGRNANDWTTFVSTARAIRAVVDAMVGKAGGK